MPPRQPDLRDIMNIITPEQFKTIPWKNGQGMTTELAISPNSSIDDFQWRLSIASVTNDGGFSNFSGLQRNLVLIEGKGIKLNHDNQTESVLQQTLDFATFDGAVKTYGTLIDGAIKDFNIMHDPNVYDVELTTITNNNKQHLDRFDFCFIYPLEKPIRLISIGDNAKQNNVQVPAKHLVRLDFEDAPITLEGGQLILIKFLKRAS